MGRLRSNSTDKYSKTWAWFPKLLLATHPVSLSPTLPSFARTEALPALVAGNVLRPGDLWRCHFLIFDHGVRTALRNATCEECNGRWEKSGSDATSGQEIV